MATILVPGPAVKSFQKDRPLSDLLKHQLRHFQHVESRLAPEVRATIPSFAITTPQGSAEYIGYMTALLRGIPKKPMLHPIRAAKSPVSAASLPSASAQPGAGIALAAGAEARPKDPKEKSKAPKKAAHSKKKTAPPASKSSRHKPAGGKL
jgi:hypothetical protein